MTGLEEVPDPMTILELVGLAVIAVGFALIWPPLGVIAAGCAVFAAGFVGLDRGGDDDDDEEGGTP